MPAPPQIGRPSAKGAVEGEIVSVEMTKSCARDLTDRIKAAVSDVAEMLHRAHEGRAWRALGYASWTEYCRAEFEMSRPRAYQLLDFVEIKREIEKSTAVDPPRNERQARALKLVPAEKRVQVWTKATEAAGGERPTAKQVTEQASRKTPPKLPSGLRDEIRETIGEALNRVWAQLARHPEVDWQTFCSALAMPHALCDRLAATADPDEVKAILDEAMRGLLTEAADLPNRIDAAEWARFLAEQEAGGGEPVAKSGKQGRRERTR